MDLVVCIVFRTFGVKYQVGGGISLMQALNAEICMIKTFRCVKCGRRLFDVHGGEPTTALSIKCQRCGTVSVFDYTSKKAPEPRPKESR